MTIPMLLPADFDRDDFLRHYWQKKPLLIRAANRDFRDPIEPDELAGLACESFVESRLISSDASQQQWQLRSGPFTDRDFSALPPSHWSLLVQAADQYHDGVRAMLREFDFIPSWRIDDIMISFASDGGGVGPHFDYYDVFLIQGLGRKRWRVGGHADSSSALIPGTDLRLLQHFETQEEWIVEPGDILYLPPNVAHYGTALGDSLTYSVGFRAPSLAQIIDDLSSEIMQDLQEDQRYVDTDPVVPRHRAEITPAIGRQLAGLLREKMLDESRLQHWFARYMTRPKYAGGDAENPGFCQDHLTSAELQAALARGEQLQVNPASRFAFAEGPEGRTLYVNGQLLPCPAVISAWVPTVCSTMTAQQWPELFSSSPAGANLVTELYNQGSLLFMDTD